MNSMTETHIRDNNGTKSNEQLITDSVRNIKAGEFTFTLNLVGSGLNHDV